MYDVLYTLESDITFCVLFLGRFNRSFPARCTIPFKAGRHEPLSMQRKELGDKVVVIGTFSTSRFCH
jgi:hypothetical protein